MKRLICIFMVLVMIGTMSTFGKGFLEGDVNGDGACDVLDCYISERELSGHNYSSVEDKSTIDLNEDGHITRLDLRLLINRALGMIPFYSIGNDKTVSVFDLPSDEYTLLYESDEGVILDYKEICKIDITGEGEFTYDAFIAENIAPQEATGIGIYNSGGEKIATIPIGALSCSCSGEKQYSFAAVSDTHIGAKTSEDDLKSALEFFESDTDIEFATICGDLTLGGSETNLNLYKTIIDEYATIPVYAISGNHETNASFAPLAMDSLQPYTQQDLYYSFTKGNDVYVMMGMYDVHEGFEFAEGELQWLYEILEANRNKRCFLFMHLYPRDGSGDAIDLDLAGDMLNNTQGKVFYSLLSHYSNVIYFHGHSHEKFELQEYNEMNNYDNIFGCHSIHIPSLAYPKSVSEEKLVSDYDASEGYVVDVYENNIVLKGRDFVNGEYLPIATYCLNTEIKEVKQNTYYDPTGTIVNSNSNVLEGGNSWYKSSIDKGTITKISFVDEYKEKAFDECWDASLSGNNQVVVYRSGTELTIAGNENGIVANTNSKEMFSGFKNLLQIVGLEKLKTGNITDINGMFKNCSSLSAVNLEGFRNVKPVDMMNVFSGCKSLESIDLSGFDLSDVNKYTNLFYNCSSLKNFEYADNISENPSSVYCYNMFGNCNSLVSFDMSIFDEKNLNLGSTFSGCTSLENIKFGKNKLLAFNSTFMNCINLVSIDISGLDLYNVDNINKIFEGCESLEYLILPNAFDTGKIKTMRSVFAGCTKLNLDCSHWDTSSLTDITSFNSGAPNVIPPVLITQ